MAMVELGIALEQVKHILHAEFADGLAAFDGGLGQFALSFLQFEDAFFDRVVDGEAVDGDVDGLVETVDTVDGLFFDELYKLRQLGVSVE
jgi:hypothetical protein